MANQNQSLQLLMIRKHVKQLREIGRCPPLPTILYGFLRLNDHKLGTAHHWKALLCVLTFCSTRINNRKQCILHIQLYNLWVAAMVLCYAIRPNLTYSVRTIIHMYVFFSVRTSGVHQRGAHHIGNKLFIIKTNYISLDFIGCHWAAWEILSCLSSLPLPFWLSGPTFHCSCGCHTCGTW